MTRPRRELGAARRSAARKLANAVTGLMRQLGMPGGRFEIARRVRRRGGAAGARVRTASSSW